MKNPIFSTELKFGDMIKKEIKVEKWVRTKFTGLLN